MTAIRYPCSGLDIQIDYHNPIISARITTLLCNSDMPKYNPCYELFHCRALELSPSNTNEHTHTHLTTISMYVFQFIGLVSGSPMVSKEACGDCYNGTSYSQTVQMIFLTKSYWSSHKVTLLTTHNQQRFTISKSVLQEIVRVVSLHTRCPYQWPTKRAKPLDKLLPSYIWGNIFATQCWSASYTWNVNKMTL